MLTPGTAVLLGILSGMYVLMPAKETENLLIFETSPQADFFSDFEGVIFFLIHF